MWNLTLTHAFLKKKLYNIILTNKKKKKKKRELLSLSLSLSQVEFLLRFLSLQFVGSGFFGCGRLESSVFRVACVDARSAVGSPR
jgi:hypothetical protein